MGDLEAALAACCLSESPNYSQIARAFNVERSTLSRRHRGVTRSAADSRNPRTKADYSATYSHHFDLLKQEIEKYNVQPQNIYNLDEKEFLSGVGDYAEKVSSRRQYESDGLLEWASNGAREWITVLACICADGTALPPALIYKDSTGDIKDTWTNGSDHEAHDVYWAASEDGWSNDDLYLAWVTTCFDRETKDKASSTSAWRLLILDDYGLHVTRGLLEFCMKRRILVAVLPLHSTHHLQPLDVSLFSPLATCYYQELEALLCESSGCPRIDNSDISKILWTAWGKAMTKSNIESGFRKTGIHPYDPSQVLDILQTSQKGTANEDSGGPMLATQGSRPSAFSATEWREAKAYLDGIMGPQAAQAKELENAIYSLSAQVSALRAQNQSLERAVAKQKRAEKAEQQAKKKEHEASLPSGRARRPGKKPDTLAEQPLENPVNKTNNNNDDDDDDDVDAAAATIPAPPLYTEVSEEDQQIGSRCVSERSPEPPVRHAPPTEVNKAGSTSARPRRCQRRPRHLTGYEVY